MHVIKRDGRKVEFDASKIETAIEKAFVACGKDAPITLILDLTETATQILRIHKIPRDLDIEQIQDAVESALMISHPEVAKAYILYREEHSKARALVPDKTAIAGYIHASKYAKYIVDLKRRESYEETVTRVCDMHCEKFPQFAREIREAFFSVYGKKVLPSMRSMQFAGRAINDHNARMYNCCFTLIDRPEAFGQSIYLLLCGCGVGFSVQSQHVSALPKLKHIDTNKVMHCEIVDSIEGWAGAVTELIKSYIHGYHIEFTYDHIRPRGSALVSSGGKAPGHLSLKKALENMRSVLHKAQGRHLKPIECHDIMCFLSEAVLAGGIRRSSMISLFSYEDEEMRYAKDPANFDYDGTNYQRSLANNSVAFLRNNVTYTQFMDVMEQNRTSFGEPGFVFLDDLNNGVNPCGEIGLDPILDDKTGFGFCNLTEINVAGCEGVKDLMDAAYAATIIGTLQASYTDFPYLGKVSEEIARRDALLGVSLTGIMDNPSLIMDKDVLQNMAETVKRTNKQWAEKLGIKEGKALTCIKPSGTASLELGCVGSGIHAHHAKRYFRRVTANPLEPVAQYFRDNNPHMVEEMPNGDWSIVFPIQTDGITNQTAQEQLDAALFMQRFWVWRCGGHRHNVSCTITVDDWDVLKSVWDHRHQLKALSFIPKGSDKKIPFCPREAVLEEDLGKWNKLIREYKPVPWEKMVEDEDNTTRQLSQACVGDSCSVDHNDIIATTGFVFSFPGFDNYEVGDVFRYNGMRIRVAEVQEHYLIGVYDVQPKRAD